MAISTELKDILQALRELETAIPDGQVRDTVYTVLHLIGHAHKADPTAEDYPVEICKACGGPWPCRALRAVHDVAKAVTAVALEQRQSAGNRRVI